MGMLARGDIDAMVSLDSFGAQERVIPVCKIGASDYYFAVNKDRHDLLNELNTAMLAIQDEDPYFNQRMFDEYIHLTKTNAFLSPSLESWLTSHGAVRVGYLEDYLPFCAYDKTSGEMTGALKDYLAYASNCLKNASIQFETVPYSTTDAALLAMKAGKIDCVFPVNLGTYDGELSGIMTVTPVMKTEMSVLMLPEKRGELTPGNSLTIAITAGNTNLETFIKDEIPHWSIKTCQSEEDCFRAVAANQADGVLAGNYRMYAYEPLRTHYKLIALPTGEAMGFSFAVSLENHELYSILNKIANLSPSSNMEYALLSYMYSSQKISFIDFLKENWIGAIVLLTLLFSVILFLFKKKLDNEKSLNEQQKQIEEALRRELEQKEQLKSVTQMAYRDALTGVKSKNAFVEAEEQLDQRIEKKEIQAFAIVLFDLNGLKEINDSQGHDEGDRFIKEGCAIICTRFKHSPVFRIGGDEFVAILEGSDFEEREALFREFDSLMESNRAQGKITIASGYACFDPEKDQNAHVVLDRADARMYQRKKQMKEKGNSIA